MSNEHAVHVERINPPMFIEGIKDAGLRVVRLVEAQEEFIQMHEDEYAAAKDFFGQELLFDALLEIVSQLEVSMMMIGTEEQLGAHFRWDEELDRPIRITLE